MPLPAASSRSLYQALRKGRARADGRDVSQFSLNSPFYPLLQNGSLQVLSLNLGKIGLLFFSFRPLHPAALSSFRSHPVPAQLRPQKEL